MKKEIQNPEIERRFSKEEINALPLRHYEGEIVLVRTPAELRDATARLRTAELVGFDTETRPAFRKGQSYPPALVQLAGPDAVFIFQLKRLGFPKPLRDLLADPRLTKAGVACDRDIDELRALARFKPAAFIDLGSAAREAGLQNHGLRGMTAVLLGFRISKGARQSNWARTDLTEKQLRYAATDAWVGRRLFEEMSKRNLL
jgi:ribonuclease D